MHTMVPLSNGTLVVIAGYGASLLRDVWTSSDAGESWHVATSAAPFTARAGHASTALSNDTILVAGGDDGGDRSDVWRSTDGGSTWAQATPSATWSARRYHAMTAVGGAVVLAGGHTSAGFFNDVWTSSDAGTTWSIAAPEAAWVARSQFQLVTLADGSLLVMGGQGSVYHNDVWRSSDLGVSFQLVGTAGWSPRVALAAAVVGDSVIVTGGTHSGTKLGDVWVSVDAGATWEQKTGPPWSARYGLAMAALPDGRLVLSGGNADVGNMNDVWSSGPTGVYWSDEDCNSALRGVCGSPPVPVTVSVSLPQAAGHVTPPNVASWSTSDTITITSPVPAIVLAAGQVDTPMSGTSLIRESAAHFAVTFTSAVTRLTADDFRIDTGGLAVVSAVTLVGLADTYTLSVALSPAAVATCPAGYVASTVGSAIICTRVVDEQLSWNDASAQCGPFGLAAVSDVQELRVLSALRTWDASSYWCVGVEANDRIACLGRVCGMAHLTLFACCAWLCRG